MSVVEIARAISGDYVATGAYSLEFRRPGATPILGYISTGIEIFLLTPPEEVEVVETPRSSLQRTLTGGIIADYGNDFKRITVSGSVHFFYAGAIRNKGVFGATGAAAGLQLNPALDPDTQRLQDGFTEFMKLRFILSRYRDYTMTPGGKLIAPYFTSAPEVFGFRQVVERLIDSGQGALADSLEVIWHDYDDDTHYKVRVDQFVMRRTSRDPWSGSYTMVMDGYQVDSESLRNITFTTPTVVKTEIHEKVREVAATVSVIHPATIPDSVELHLHTTIPVPVSVLDVSAITLAQAAQQLSFDRVIAATNQKLADLRTIFAQKASQVLEARAPVKEIMGNIIDQITTQIDDLVKLIEKKFIPENKFADFQDGSIFLQDYADFDSIVYYNELTKLKWGYLGIKASLSLITETKAEPLSASTDGNSFGALSEEEFLTASTNRKPSTEVQSNYTYYTIQQGDTLPDIASRHFGDYEKFPDIARLNGITNSDLLDGLLVGQTIKLPALDALSNSKTNTPIFEKVFQGVDPLGIQKYLFGTDLLTNNRTLVPNSQGDLSIVSGVECVAANVYDRFQAKKGGLNPLHPEWGYSLPDTSKAPALVRIARAIKSLEEQTAQDPRVISAKADLSTLHISADGIFVDVGISLSGAGTARLEKNRIT